MLNCAHTGGRGEELSSEYEVCLDSVALNGG